MRYERKYRTEDLTLAEVTQIVRDHPMSFRRLYPDRQVNNVYFDTPELHFLHENLHGVAERRKYRIRWYGADTTQALAPILEMKCKDGELGDKFTVALPPLAIANSDLMRAQFATGFKALHAQQPSASLLAAQDLVPVLLNTYQRSYLISYNGKFRLTIDRAMHHHGFNARQQPHRQFAHDEAVVLELKYDQDDDDQYQSVAQRIPLRLARNSKYTIGMLLVANV